MPLTTTSAGQLGELTVLGEHFVPIATGTETEGAYEFFEVTALQDAGPPPHRHDWSEAYLVLDGELEVISHDGNPASTILQAGGFAHIPANAVHSYRVASATARFITFTTPAGAGRFFRAMSETIKVMPDDVRHIPGLASSNGVTIVLPS